MLPSVGSSEAGRKPVGPIEPATKRSSPTALRAISAAWRLISSVCSPRPHSSSFSAAGLEGVGLDDLGAGLDHRLVDALDDVGAVEHERLVAAAGEPVVVLEREVELLERGAHAAVEDDDVVADGGQEVTHAKARLANLDTSVSRLVRTLRPVTENDRAQRLARLASVAHAAEARGDGWAAGEAWRSYELVRDGGRDPDELLAEGVALSVMALDLAQQSERNEA